MWLLGRRGPAQAAFTLPEVRELGELDGCDVRALPGEVELDALSRAELDRTGDRAARKKVELLQAYAARRPSGKPKLLTLRFLVSPTSIEGDAGGRVRGMTLVHNRLEADGSGALRAVATDSTERLPVELVFRSVGYRGVPLPDVPFDETTGIVPNAAGRVIHPDTLHRIPGLYVAGWIKRGPTGVIGTNKPDAVRAASARHPHGGAAVAGAAVALRIGRTDPVRHGAGKRVLMEE